LPTGFPGLVFQAGISGTWKEIKHFSQVLASVAFFSAETCIKILWML